MVRVPSDRWATASNLSFSEWGQVIGDPLNVVGVLFAVGVADGLDQVLIAAGAPAVLGWARSLTIDTDGELRDRRHRSIDSTTTSWRYESPKSYS
jgi:hypothetical protein